MANTNNAFNLLNIQETGSGGGPTTTIIQQVTDTNLFYTKVTTDGLLNNKADKSTLASDYYNKANIDSKVDTINNTIATKANNTQLDLYYTKTQTDNLLRTASGTVDLSNYYDKPNIDGKVATLNTAIATKANSTALANYYTTSQVDSSLALKQNKTDLEANYYTKTQVDNRITSVASGGTVSLDNYYTKTQIDTSLAAKQNVTDMNIALLSYYTKADITANYYDKTNIDGKVTTINTSIGTKANSSDVYTKTDADAKYRLITDSYTKAGVDGLWSTLNTTVGTKANSADVYTKTVADGKYRLIADSYTKTDIDSSLALKANLSDVYTKAQADTAISAAASSGSGGYTKTQIDDALALKANIASVYDKANIDTKITNILTTRPTYDDLTGYLQKGDAMIGYNPKLTQVPLPSGKVGFTFVNTATNKIRNLYIRNATGEALELLYDSTTDNIVLGLDMTKITTAIGTYTVSQADAKFRQISDSYSTTQVYSKTEADAKYQLISNSYNKTDLYTKAQIDDKTTVLQAGIDITYTKVESDNRYRKIVDSYTKTELDSRILGYDTTNNWYTLNNTLVIKSPNPGQAVLRIVPSSDNGEASIGFLNRASPTDYTGSWVMGVGSWGAGDGSFAIGRGGLNLLFGIDGVSGNLTVAKDIYSKGSKVLTNDSLLGQVYTKTEIDGTIDQKYYFYNPPTNPPSILTNKWVKLGTVTHPTALLSECFYKVMRIYFVQNIYGNDDYYMTVLFKFSSQLLGGTASQPMKGSCEYTIMSKTTSLSYPQLVFTQDTVGSNTIFGFYLNTVTGAPCNGMLLVNGPAPFVFDGTFSTSAGGAIQKTIDPVFPFSNYNPPGSASIPDLDSYVWSISTQKYLHPNQDGVTRYFRLGKLLLAQGGLHAIIRLSACQGYNITDTYKATQPRLPQNYCAEIFVYSGNANSSTVNSFVLNAGSNTSGQADNGCFHWGFVSNNTKWSRPNNVYLCPDIGSPTDTVYVWVEHTGFWGKPMITVDTNGDWLAQPVMSATLPSTGWVVLPFNSVSTI